MITFRFPYLDLTIEKSGEIEQAETELMVNSWIGVLLANPMSMSWIKKGE